MTTEEEQVKGKDATLSVRILCRKLVIIPRNETGLQWLIGSPFFPPFTIVSTFRCIHTLPDSLDGSSPDFDKESDEIRTLLLKGFQVIGALVVGGGDLDSEKTARQAVAAARKLREVLSVGEGKVENGEMIGAVAGGDVRFFVSSSGDSKSIVAVDSVFYEDNPGHYIWERGCLLRCQLPISLPFFVPANSPSDAEKMFLRAAEAVIAKFKDPRVAYMVERPTKGSEDVPQTVILHGAQLDFDADLSSVGLVGDEASQASDVKILTCDQFCLKSKSTSAMISAENADRVQLTVLLNRSAKCPESTAPLAEFLPALEEAIHLVVNVELEVICYASKDLPLMCAVSKLIIPGLIDQLNSVKKTILPNLLTQHPQLHLYQFDPPGFLHPITVIYELSYGETELQQVEVRRSLHLRLGLPFDRPLLRIANSLDFSLTNDISGSNSRQKGSSLLRDVHLGIPNSGVAGGYVSIIQGSYEYYHYLQDGFDDSGWGCAYRSLQTIISWFRLQHYASIHVPTHREIQQCLVEIGDKDPSFIGSREWIGAIELSFVLDKLLGVSCKIINVRSGAELPEKCRELAVHFENQGTPIMIGGGVLAYTLLGVDYNEGTGDGAFLILDPHYTGSDEHKKIVNGGWCGWKKAIDSKGKSFFLHDKFYNLLLPQRPNMV